MTIGVGALLISLPHGAAIATVSAGLRGRISLSRVRAMVRMPSPAAEPACIYLVATPIGNMDDITLRALKVLRAADILACEDTRRTSQLLHYHGIPGRRLVAYHAHNWRGMVPELLSKARGEGKSIAVVSDAGTPGISDPGNELVRAANAAGVRVVAVPGACAAVAAVSLAGLHDGDDFTFVGFLPASGAARRRRLREVAGDARAVVLYEAPHRVLRTLEDLVTALGEAGHARPTERGILCARELTKVHEEVFRGTLASARAHYDDAGAGVVRGEFTLVLLPDDALAVARAAEAEDKQAATAEALLLQRATTGDSLSSAVKDVVAATNLPKRVVYAMALAIWPPQRPRTDPSN